MVEHEDTEIRMETGIDSNSYLGGLGKQEGHGSINRIPQAMDLSPFIASEIFDDGGVSLALSKRLNLRPIFHEQFSRNNKAQDFRNHQSP